MIYIFIAILLLLLSFRYDLCGRNKGKSLWYNVVLLILILVAGLRWRLGVDTVGYLNTFYHKTPFLENFSLDDYPIGKDPLFRLMNSVVLSIGGRFYIVQLLHAAFVNILIFKYIKKHSNYIFVCIFFYFITRYIVYNTEIMRASMSIVICLFANDYILERKWTKGYLLYFIALLFHAQAILMFFIPFFFFLRLNIKGVLFLMGAYCAGYYISSLLGDYLFLLFDDDIIIGKAQKYVESENYGTGDQYNFVSIIQNFLPRIIYLMWAIIWLKKNRPQSRLLKLEPLALFFIMFLLIQINLRIAYRYVDCFYIYAVLFYSELFVGISQKANYNYGIRLVRSLIIFIPILVFFGIRFTNKRINPYSSVIEKSIDNERERLYREDAIERAAPNLNEY